MWEEMQRAVKYCHWLAAWWREQAGRRADTSPTLKEGLVAYAMKQAASEDALGTAWAAKFQPVRQRAEEFLVDTHLRGILQLGDLALSNALDSVSAVPPPVPEHEPHPEEPVTLERDLVEISLEDPAETYLFDDETDDF